MKELNTKYFMVKEVEGVSCLEKWERGRYFKSKRQGVPKESRGRKE